MSSEEGHHSAHRETCHYGHDDVEWYLMTIDTHFESLRVLCVVEDNQWQTCHFLGY
jgi:hypothetical protein